MIGVFYDLVSSLYNHLYPVHFHDVKSEKTSLKAEEVAIKSLRISCLALVQACIMHLQSRNYKLLKASGKGKEVRLKFSNGATFEGLLENDRAQDCFGVLKNRDGDLLQGYFSNELHNCFGVLKKTSGSYREGWFVNGKQEGIGRYLSSDGEHYYKGTFQEGSYQGFGNLYRLHLYVLRGYFEKNQTAGLAEISTSDGLILQVSNKNGAIVPDPNFDVEKVASQEFFSRVILGQNQQGVFPVINLAILACFLKNASLFKQAELLENARLIFDENPNIAAHSIWNMLQHPKANVLIPYGSSTHIVGMLISNEGDFFQISIFNSGEGLDFHKRKLVDGKMKFQTRKNYFVSKQKLTKDVIHFFLEAHNINSTINDAYQQIAVMHDERFKKEITAPIWQSIQKGKNCSIEWIFSFLKNSLQPYQYDLLRLNIFEFCLNALNQNDRINADEKNEMKQLLLQKIEKRRLRLARYIHSETFSTK